MTNITALVIWTVVTNWGPVSVPTQYIPCPSYPNLPRIEVINETGNGREQATLTSNLAARILWKGELKEFVLESHDFMVTNRTWKTERIYEPGPSSPIILFPFLMCSNNVFTVNTVEMTNTIIDVTPKEIK